MNAALRILTWLLALALVALPVVAVVNGWIGAERWPLTKLRAHGEFQHVDAAQLRAVVLPYARRGFFAVRLQEAQDAVEKLPWVERAEVRKRWPDVMEIRIVEHQPFARWGDDRLLSEHGRLFPVPKGMPVSSLPHLAGPDSQVSEVVALYNEARALFVPAGFKVASVRMDKRGSWSLALDSGLQVVVGRTDARPRLGRFAGILPYLLARNPAQLQRADLRYTNGFALTWKEPAAGSGEPVAGQQADASIPVTGYRLPATRPQLAHASIPHSLFSIHGLTT